jgi:hypothetical protein
MKFFYNEMYEPLANSWEIVLKKEDMKEAEQAI